MTEPILGFDASRYQGNKGMPVGWLSALKKCGAKWAMFKATQGTGFTDPSFARNVARARKLKMFVAAYHFLEDGDGAKQADHLFAVAKAVGLDGLALVVDVERVPTATTSDDPRWPTVRDFVKRLKALAPRNQIWLYTSEGYWRAIGNHDANGLVDDLIQARWTGGRHTCADPNLPAQAPRAGFAGFGRTPLWQYGSFRFQVRTGGKSIDGDAFYGSLADLEEVFTGSRPKPPTVPIPDRPNFRVGYNAAVDAWLAAQVKLPAGPSGPAYPAGAAEALDDIKQAIAGLKLADPNTD